MSGDDAPAPDLRRRYLGAALAAIPFGALLFGRVGLADERRHVVAFANLTEEAGVTIEGTGFTGRDVREGFLLAARNHPVDLVLYDNQRDNRRAITNVEDAIARNVALFVQYHRDAATNAAAAERLRAARIPILAVGFPVPGAPLYTADNLAAGRIGGEALGRFAETAWRGQRVIGVLLGPLGADADRVPERVQGVKDGLRRHLPALPLVTLDTQGHPPQVPILLGKVLAAQPAAKLLVAAMDDATALAAKSALETAGRAHDAAIVGHGVDRSIHGGVSEKKEIDPNNRGSIVIGSVAFYLDRYGHDVLPLALRILKGETVPLRTTTRHLLVTAANVFREYPPYDMN